MLRARLELAAAVVSAVLAVATFIWPTWIESLSGLEPDGGSGESEWWVALIFAAVSLALIILARRDRRAFRSRPATAAED
jgi:hypothetical protein